MCYHLFLNEIPLDLRCAGFQILSCRVPGPGTRNSVRLTQISADGTWLLVGQHKPRTWDSMFCKTTSVPSKAMSRQHLLLSSNNSQLQIFICRVPDPGTRNLDLGTRKSVCFTRILVVRSGCLIGQHKPRTQDSMFCKTTYATSKAMLREHLLSSEKSHLRLAI
jgi:hypothetical protein